MAELVDAYVSGAYVERRAGSSPVLGTKVIFYITDSRRFGRSYRAFRHAQVVKLVYTLL